MCSNAAAFLLLVMALVPAAEASATCNVTLAKQYNDQANRYDKLRDHDSEAQSYMAESNMLNTCESPDRLSLEARVHLS